MLGMQNLLQNKYFDKKNVSITRAMSQLIACFSLWGLYSIQDSAWVIWGGLNGTGAGVSPRILVFSWKV
jgi:hypothetical protein